jgi:hypothetical protein
MTNDTKTTVRADELVPGTRFVDPTAQRERVEVVCPRGACTHEERDRYSVHVRRIGGSMQWFSAFHDDEALELV